MDIIDLYKSILNCGGMKADEEGFVSSYIDHDHPTPVLVDAKRLVLPTDTQLRHGDFQNTIRFHPLVESLHRGESEVGEVLREHIDMNLNVSLCYIAISLLTLAISPAEHTSLAPDQTIFMSAVKDADEGTIERLAKISEAMMMGDTQKSFVHVYVKRGATIKGKKHVRAGIVTFPLYEALKVVPEPKQPNEVFGVKLRKIDREALTNLLEYMIPGIDKPENFTSTSDSTVAPFLSALMKATANVAVHINSMIDLFDKRLPEGETLRFDLDWMPTFEDLSVMAPQIRLIPMQAGNEGKLPTKTAIADVPVIEAPTGPTAETVRPVASIQPTAVAQTPADPKAVDHFGRPLGEHKRPLITPPPAAQPYQPRPSLNQPSHNPYANPAPVYPQQQPMHQPYQPAPYASPAPVHNANGRTDFRSLMASNPQLAQAAGMGMQPSYAQGPQADLPRWAAGPGYGYNQGYGGRGGNFGNV